VLSVNTDYLGYPMAVAPQLLVDLSQAPRSRRF